MAQPKLPCVSIASDYAVLETAGGRRFHYGYDVRACQPGYEDPPDNSVDEEWAFTAGDGEIVGASALGPGDQWDVTTKLLQGIAAWVDKNAPLAGRAEIGG